ncbi:MAG: FKBP-type peptidyl-prolyl cis-trans isomerase [Acidobacteria bacterium]|nr:FKBP-type peptidyl-prolyl cis-trans isomerase [Acidobacteriota bacterium]
MIGRIGRMGIAAWLCAAVMAGTGCRSAVTAPSVYAPFSTTDLVVGTGDVATRGQLVLVEYTGWIYDGSRPDNKGAIFDTSSGRTPYAFTLGLGEVITGWDDGLEGIRVGGTRRLVLPPSKAYGDTRSGAIPPNSTLIFEVELVAIQ